MSLVKLLIKLIGGLLWIAGIYIGAGLCVPFGFLAYFLAPRHLFDRIFSWLMDLAGWYLNIFKILNAK
jgi:hypothetical protein